MAEDLDARLKRNLLVAYGAPRSLTENDMINYVAFFHVKDSEDPTFAKYKQCMRSHKEHLLREKERAARRLEEKKVHELQKQRYKLWQERRDRHQSLHAEPFPEPPPTVNKEVLDFLNKEQENK